ncbi:hypothetical protein CBR_g55052 [Chara braunii]|uniref:Uncharacterized protein n=1 Tax=Chara braunii TaxID=69332 RepID=A0A388MCP8_CHABU|nr:hypothetical protein CBR_g55052 [Chara braunii]|eukprot:GBG92283.1 hypothetical protein CBR_g55052 [Chara braunii]
MSPLLARYNDKRHYCDITDLPKSLQTPAKEIRLLHLGAEINSLEPPERLENGLGIKIATKPVSWQDIQDRVTPEEHMVIREEDVQMMAMVFSWRSDNSFISAPPPENTKRMNTKHIDVRIRDESYELHVPRYVPDEIHHLIADILKEYRGAISVTNTDIGLSLVIQHEIQTGNHSPIHCKPYRLTWTRDEEHYEWFECLELMIIQACRTNVEGDLLGFLFGSIRPGHRQLIVQELAVPLAQLVDDLPVEIVSQSDESPVPHVLARTLTPYLQWSACLEEPGSSRNPPSQRDYLDPREIIDLAFFQDRAGSEDEEIEIKEEEEEEEEEGEEEEAAEEDEEEETPEKGSYSEHSEGEQSEEEEEDEEEEEELELEESEWEISAEEAEQANTQVEDPEALRKREEIAVGKRHLEFASGANLQIVDDPARDLELPKPEDGDPAAETSSAPTRRRRRQSPSPSASDRPSVRARTDAGLRASSPIIIPPSP